MTLSLASGSLRYPSPTSYGKVFRYFEANASTTVWSRPRSVTLRVGLDHDVVADHPAAAGGQDAVGIAGQVAPLLLGVACRHVDGVIDPNARYRGHVRPAVAPDGRQPVGLGRLQLLAGFPPRGR
jgi:hypothetical protein